MAYTGTPVVRNGRVWLARRATEIQVDTPAWFRWLHTVTSFSYALGSPTYYSPTCVKKNGGMIRTGMPTSKVTASYTTLAPVVPKLYPPHIWTTLRKRCCKRFGNSTPLLLKRNRTALDIFCAAHPAASPATALTFSTANC